MDHPESGASPWTGDPGGVWPAPSAWQQLSKQVYNGAEWQGSAEGPAGMSGPTRNRKRALTRCDAAPGPTKNLEVFL